MIGYVQAGTLCDWQQRLGRYAQRNARRLSVAPGGDWRDYKCALPNSSITKHRHPSFRKLAIVHLLLGFC